MTTLIKYALHNDLNFQDIRGDFTTQKIFVSLTMTVYPRSLAGFNLNPKKQEMLYQMNSIYELLKRMKNKTYLNQCGWVMLRNYTNKNFRPEKSTCDFEEGKKNVLFYQSIFSYA